jgi:arylformamidase
MDILRNNFTGKSTCTHRPAANPRTGYLSLLNIQQICDEIKMPRCEMFRMTYEMESQYNNRTRIAETPALLKGWADDAQNYRRNLADAGRAELNLEYGTSPRQIVDVFWPAADSGGHLTAFIHGGYWQLFEPALFSHVARGVNERGLPMALIGYDLCPDVTLEKIVGQTQAACMFLWQRYQRRLVLSGHSAGGHLTAAMITTDWAAKGASIQDIVAAGLAISGVFELSPLLKTSMNEKLRLNADSARALSPIYWPPGTRATIEAWVGEAESEEFQRQSSDFVKVWRTAGASARFELIAGANHFTAIAPLQNAQSPMVDRLVDFAQSPKDPIK